MRKQREKNPKEETEESDWEIDKPFYLYIWDMREHKCFETGKWLGNEPLSVFFHHLLPKEKYPQFRHSSWNIVLVSWETHDQIHIDMDKTPKVKEKYLELLNKLNKN